MNTKRILKLLLGVGIIAYLGLCIGLFFFQEKVLFMPWPMEHGYHLNFKQPFEERTYTMDDGANIHAVFFTNKGEKLLYYLHGNGGHMTRAVTMSDLDVYLQKGYDVLYIDYRTYGKSTGELSEKALLTDADNIYKQAIKEYEESNVVVYGKSMGSGFAAYVASKNKPGKLVLETPYYSMKYLAEARFPILPADLVLRYPLRSDKYLEKFNNPILMFHGTNDRVIPYENAEKLASELKAPHQLITIKGGSHNFLNRTKEFQEALSNFL